MIIVAGMPDGSFGTHRVLPRFAIICSNILVAILCRFFFLSVPSVVIWQIILFLSSAKALISLYLVLS